MKIETDDMPILLIPFIIGGILFCAISLLRLAGIVPDEAVFGAAMGVAITNSAVMFGEILARLK